MNSKNTHYVYYSYEEWGRGYIGVRSCSGKASEDIDYMGSFYDLTFKPTCKIIIQEFESREDALDAEIKLHEFFAVDKNPAFANKARQTNTRFSCCGPRSEEFKRKISEAKKGKKLTKEHIEKVSLARSKKLKGRKLSEEHRGKISKALKGRKIANHSFGNRLTKQSRKVVLRHVQTGIIYEFGSISRACNETGIKRSNIYALFENPHYIAKGYQIVLEDSG